MTKERDQEQVPENVSEQAARVSKRPSLSEWRSRITRDEDAAPDGEDTLPRAPHEETVLVVEDEAVVREFVSQVLQMHGYSVLQASDGVEALELARDHKGRLDLLLTDVIMPRMNGRDLVERLSQVHADAKILFMSGYTSSAIVQHGVLNSGYAFLQKPFTPEQLLDKVRNVLLCP